MSRELPKDRRRERFYKASAKEKLAIIFRMLETAEERQGFPCEEPEPRRKPSSTTKRRARR